MKQFILCSLSFLSLAFLSAQTQPADIPVKRIALFSSGVGYFEHSGSVSGAREINLSFEVEAVNDALKSLAVNDPAGGSPNVSYPSEETLERTLRSLGINLSGNPGTAAIFAGQRGADVEVSAPNPVSGRILGVEYRAVMSPGGAQTQEAYLSLVTSGGIRIIALKDIASFVFKDASLNADIKRALDLIASNRTTRNRSLLVRLPGGGNREVSLSYVISVPVWKVSYRLDLSQAKPLFQGWAIIDNNSDTDWNNVELSLVSGRPVSFIQELYPPYYSPRPTLPLAIAGTAQARTYDSGYDRAAGAMADYSIYDDEDKVYEMAAPQAAMAKSARNSEYAPAPAAVSRVEAAAGGRAAGDQFAYTVKNPVTLLRRQSAMLPLVSTTVEAAKTLIFGGNQALSGNIHPNLAVELTNTTGMKIPAGPITVYDGGTYAGDALIEFFGENDKRFITYGEDLSVTASASVGAGSRNVSTVTLAGGVMTINRRQIHERTYTVKNTASEAKRVIIEHPITGGAALVEPSTYLEKTAAAYRFLQALPRNGELTFRVREESPLSERIVLGQLRADSLLSYSASQEIPANVRALLSRAVELRQKADEARQTLSELEARRTRLMSDQDRVRQNLSAVGSSSDLGRDYMRRMTALDSDIDALNGEINKAGVQVKSSQKEFDDYIAGLKL